jgi:hypothetical protein
VRGFLIPLLCCVGKNGKFGGGESRITGAIIPSRDLVTDKIATTYP